MNFEKLKFKLLILLLILSTKGYSDILDHWTCYPSTLYLSNGDSLIGCVLLYEIDATNLLVSNNSVGFCSSIDYINSKVATAFWGQGNRQIFSSDAVSDTMIEWIKIKTINSAKVYGNEKRTLFIEYKNLHHDNTLWKLLKSKDSIGIYNNLIFPVEKYLGTASNMVLVTQNEIIEIYGFWQMFLSNSRVDKMTIRFINKRYSKDFKKKDFKDINAMFDYILENK